MRDRLIDAFANMQEKEALQIAQDMLDSREDPLEVVRACRDALEIIGKRFETGEAYLPELMMAGEMMGQISALTKPKIQGNGEAKRFGKVLIGTVGGDIHDIGKNIVVFLLDAHGFEVIDIGVDVPPQVFVERIQDTQARVVGMSGLLTLAFDSMKTTVEAIEKSGLRDRVKIMIGGSPVNEQVCTYARADAWGSDAMSAVILAKQWLGGA